MPNTEPIRHYLAAVEALKRDSKQEAVELLAKAIGANGPTPVMEDNITLLLAPESIANDGILTLVANEVSRKGG